MTNRSSYSQNQTISIIHAEGYNNHSTPALKNYALISTEQKSGTNNDEYGQLKLDTIQGGNMKNKLTIGQENSADSDVFVNGQLKVTSIKFSGDNSTITTAASIPTGLFDKIDAATLTHNSDRSKDTLTVQIAQGGTKTVHPNGILWGWRVYSMMIDNNLFLWRNQNYFSLNGIGPHNGSRGKAEGNQMTYGMAVGGHIVVGWLNLNPSNSNTQNMYKMRFNAVYFHFHKSGQNYAINFAVMASNDKANWTTLLTFHGDSKNWAPGRDPAYTDGKTDITKTLGGRSITFKARGKSDHGILPGASGDPDGDIDRWVFANDEYYCYYMLKMIGPSLYISQNYNTAVVYWPSQEFNELEWG